jgi:hypothetical protein
MAYGEILSDKITTSDGVSSAGLYGFKNKIINGDMRIDQRNAGASVTPTAGQYSLDRWQFDLTQASKFSVQRNAASVTPPVGFTNYLGITSLSAYSVSSSDYFRIMHKIEGFNCADLAWGTANAATVTLSFWVRSSLTGTFGGAIRNSAGNRAYPFSYTINAANTWEKETITIAGDTTGTWETGNGSGIEINLSLGAGATFSGTAGAWAASNLISATGATSVVGTNGATFYITGVQLEKGSTATSFDYRPYGTELQLCQRYLPALTADSATSFVGCGYSYATTIALIQVAHTVTPRVTPTGITTSTVTQFSAYNGGGTTAATSAIAFVFGGFSQSLIQFNSTGFTGGQGSYARANTLGAQILFTGCEL